MSNGLSLPEELMGKIDHILDHLQQKTRTDCIILADVSGQVISTQGHMVDGTPSTVAALAAGDVAAMGELTRQIGEENPHGSFFHEGDQKSIYLHNIAGSFILIVIFRAETPIGLVRLFAKRAVEKLRELTIEFEEVIDKPSPVDSEDFKSGLTRELEQAFSDD
ncbi:MAG: roadblock/LC7 domain-containing protein [Anaerolineales bacterium]|nr:roadblock/LC7 domain-containing protein [Anaerolineales bacterium]